MRFITEHDLRTLYRTHPFDFFELPEDAKLTPGARQFLIDFRIHFQENRIEQWKQKRQVKVSLPAQEVKDDAPSKRDEDIEFLSLKLRALEAELMQLAAGCPPMLMTFGSLVNAAELAGNLAQGAIAEEELKESTERLGHLPKASMEELEAYRQRFWSARMPDAGFYYQLYRLLCDARLLQLECRFYEDEHANSIRHHLQSLIQALCGLAMLGRKEADEES